MNKGDQVEEEPEDEKPILTIGGAQEIYTQNFPNTIQYVALGHLHRYQEILQQPFPVVYSSSPLAYSMSEAGQQKYVVIGEVEAGRPVQMKKISLQKGKQLVRKRFESVEEAVIWLQEHPNTWVELTLVAEQYLTAQDRKRLHEVHAGIVTIIPQIPEQDTFMPYARDVDLSRDIRDLFVDYFQYKHGQAPNSRMLDMLKEVLAEEEE